MLISASSSFLISSLVYSNPRFFRFSSPRSSRLSLSSFLYLYLYLSSFLYLSSLFSFWSLSSCSLWYSKSLYSSFLLLLTVVFRDQLSLQGWERFSSWQVSLRSLDLYYLSQRYTSFSSSSIFSVSWMFSSVSSRLLSFSFWQRFSSSPNFDIIFSRSDSDLQSLLALSYLSLSCQFSSWIFLSRLSKPQNFFTCTANSFLWPALISFTSSFSLFFSVISMSTLFLMASRSACRSSVLVWYESLES